MTTTHRTIVISDVHLGSKGCKAEQLNSFLKNHSCETLLLVGDIIDGWKIQQNKWAWRQSHTNVIRRVLGHAKRGTQVIYVAGNHDEFLRPIIPYGMTFGRITVMNHCVYRGLDQRDYMVTHGDLFDGITRLAPWISFLGDRGYDVLISVNTHVNRIRHKMGFGYWSLSKYLKLKVKKAVDFIFRFENNLADYCRRRGHQGIICGHIHNPEIKDINGIRYMNSGDWVENCSALVEDWSGQWHILYWTDAKDVDLDNSSS